MPPDGSTSRPQPDRSSQPRGSIDGFSRRRQQPHLYTDMRRPIVPRRPAGPTPAPQPVQPVSAQPLTPPPAAPQSTFEPALPTPPQPQPAALPELESATATTMPPLPTPPSEPAAAPEEPITTAEQPPGETKPQKPKRRRPSMRRVWPIIGIAAVVIAVAAGVGYFIHWQSVRNNPDTAFKDALTASLSTRQVEMQFSGGTTTMTVDHDFSSLTNPIVSSTATIQQAGASFNVSAYGTLKNTYISYKKMPSSVPAATTKAVTDAWVQLKNGGVLPAGVSASLANLADPAYQAFNPMIMGNYSLKTRTQLRDYAMSKHIYAYNPKQVTHTTIAGTKVIAYPVTLNLSYLKLLSESAVANQGIAPADLVRDASALDYLKNAKLTIYVTASAHRVMEIAIATDGQAQTVSYQDYNQVSLPDEPITKLQWQTFEPYQYQIENQVAAQQTPAQRDATRQANLKQLHDALATYFTQYQSYPTFTDLDNQVWVSKNMPTVDPELFRDPQAANLLLAAAPKAQVYAYQPTTDSGKGVCNDTDNPCVHYKLTALSSTNQPITVQDP